MSSTLPGRAVRGVAGVAAFLAIAEGVARFGLIDRDVLPPFSEVLARAAGLAADAEFRTDLLNTVTAWIVGLALAVAVAVPVGLVLGSRPRIEAAVRPLVEFMRPVPGVAIIPLAVLVFPEPLHMQAAVIVYASSWPVLINTLYGLRDVDPLAKETLRGYGFGTLAELRWVSLPSAAPFIATGVRLASAIALIVAVSSELIAGGAQGVGTFINDAGAGGRIDLMLGATVWAGALGVLANAVLVGAERRLFRWRQEVRAS